MGVSLNGVTLPNSCLTMANYDDRPMDLARYLRYPSFRQTHMAMDQYLLIPFLGG